MCVFLSRISNRHGFSGFPDHVRSGRFRLWSTKKKSRQVL